MYKSIVIILLIFCIRTLSGQDYNDTKKQIYTMIKDHKILFGIGSSAYQIEGGVEGTGKGESIWDRFVHNHPELIKDGSNADIACDSYNNLQRDVNMLQYLGVQFYRFSIAWSRILPNGFSNEINEDGLKYYHNLIDLLHNNNIIPIITMYHWDLPQPIQELGGWTNELITDFFEDYARVLFDNFATKVNIWFTFNEPDVICHVHYGTDKFPPEISSSGLADYICIHNLFLAHARVYHLYKDKYDLNNKGLMGLTATFNWFEPETDSVEDVEAGEKFIKMIYGFQIHPIYSSVGDYPELLKETISNKSIEQGFRRSRLPTFTIEEIEYVRKTFDILGVNYYTTFKVGHVASDTKFKSPSFEDDFQINFKRTLDNFLESHPEGLRKSLNYIREHYENPTVFITENGCGSFDDEIKNTKCVDFFTHHISSVYEAVVKDGCNIKAYSAWTLMDNFEWTEGYSMKFGLYQTDFNDSERRTRPKASAEFYKEILSVLKQEDITEIHPDSNTSSTNDALFILFIGTFLWLVVGRRHR